MPRADKQFFLDKFYLLVCTAENWQVFFDKEPGWKASHARFSTRKLVRVYDRQGEIDKEMRSMTLRTSKFAYVDPVI